MLSLSSRRLWRCAAALSIVGVTGALLWQLRQARQSKASVAPTPPPRAVVDDYQKTLGSLRSALVDARTPAQRLALADKLHELGTAAHLRDQGEGKISLAAYEEALALYRETGNAEKVAMTLADIGDAAAIRGDAAHARQAYAQSLGWIPKIAGAHVQASLLQRAGDFARIQGDYQDAQSALDKSLTLCRSAMNDICIAQSLRYRGSLKIEQGQLKEAERDLRESVRLLTPIVSEQATRAAVKGVLGDALLRQGRLDAAERLYHEGLALWREKRQRFWTGRFTARLARVALQRGNVSEAGRLARESLDLLEGSNGPVARSSPLFVLAEVARARGNPAEARRLHEEVLTIREHVGYRFGIQESKDAIARVIRE